MKGTRLDLALQDVAEAAASSSGFGDPDAPETLAAVHRLTARVRRRRAVRGASGAAVAASAAGAVALVAPQMTREVAPAADADAEPGQCRSLVTDLPASGGDVLSVALGHHVDTGVPQISHARGGEDLGTWQSGSADLLVSVSQTPDAGTGVTSLRLLVTQDDVVLGAGREPVALEPTTMHEVMRAELGSTDLRGTSDGPVYPLLDEDRWWEPVTTADGERAAAQTTELALVGCDGSGPLPQGTYEVWATLVDAAGTARGAAGPWDLEVAGGRTSRHQLPEGFPRDVPLISGDLVTAHRHGDGWAAEIVTPVSDRGTVALDLLARRALRTDTPDPLVAPLPRPYEDVKVSRHGLELPGWAVRAIPSQTPDGDPSIVYVLMPRG